MFYVVGSNRDAGWYLDDSSRFGNAYREQLTYRNADLYRVPTRLGRIKSRAAVMVREDSPPTDMICIAPYSGLVVSMRAAKIMQEVAPHGYEVLPVRVVSTPSKREVHDQALVNVFEQVDCVNLAATGARPCEPIVKMGIRSEIELLRHEGWHAVDMTILDPNRVPPDVHVFCLRYFTLWVYVRQSVVDALNAAGCTGFEFTPVRTQVESDEERAATLARIEREVDELNHKFPIPNTESEVTWKRVGELLNVNVPSKAIAVLTKRADDVVGSQEIFTAEKAVEKTRELRDDAELRWPQSCVVVSDDGRGGYYAIDTARAAGDDAPVVYYDHELDHRDVPTDPPPLELAAQSLSAWIRRLQRGGDATM